MNIPTVVNNSRGSIIERMNDHRQLILLVTEGTPLDDITHRFVFSRGLSKRALTRLYHSAGLMSPIHMPHNDGISEERRKELQELSLT
jgi:hypothetical protein